ncbi:MAG TPA: site-2 protease family protein [Terriglobales bacterium]|nr:site-2 protease family protein [Terriglobales bacterium]
MADPSPPIPTSTVEYYQPAPLWVEARYRQRYWLHALLLGLTIFTTLVVGSHMEWNFQHDLPALSAEDNSSIPFFPIDLVWEQPSRLLLGIPFSAALMLILLAHEMGHYLYCVHYRVQATLPFFIPFPSLIGTVGAFIRIRSPIRSRTALFDIGIAGPIAGFVLAGTTLAVSLGMSRVAANAAAAAPDRIELHYPLIFHLVDLVRRGLAALGLLRTASALPLDRVSLHPVSIAAWVGMFATSLNLLPGGQLDGGHIVFSIAPRAHRFVSRLTILVLIPMAVYLWVGWLLWAMLLGFSSFRHPQVAEWPKVTGVRRWLAVFALLMLVLTLIPEPMAIFDNGYDVASGRALLQPFLGK